MKSTGLYLACTLVLAVVAAACESRDEQAATDQMPDSAAMGAAPAMAAWPDTTAAAVWAYVEQQNYTSWPMWPGKAALYPGTEPHGARLTTYVNALAQDALSNGAASLPAHAIVVKENYMPDSTLAAVTVMYKAPGYDGAHNDWFWVKRLANGTFEIAGRAEPCFACHGTNASNDYIMTGTIAAGGTRRPGG